MKQKNSTIRVFVAVFVLGAVLVSFSLIPKVFGQEDAIRFIDADPEALMQEETRTLGRTQAEAQIRGEGFQEHQQEEQPPTILVKTGDRIFCAQCGRKVEDTVQFLEVTLEEAVNYYDDGSHHDDVPRDGLPSNIREIRDEYICPYCGELRDRLLNYWVKAKSPNMWGYYKNAAYPRHWAAVAFYGLPVAALDRLKVESPLEPLPRWSQQLEEYVAFWHSFYVQPYFQYEIHPDNIAGRTVSPGQMLWGFEDMDHMMMMNEGIGPMGPPPDFNPQSHPTADKLNRANRAAEQMR